MTAPVLHATVPSEFHDDYGASYPLTYMFSTPTAADVLEGQWKSTIDGEWQTLLEPGVAREDGIAMARFDQAQARAYLSVPFAADSDDLWLRIVNGAGNPVGEFIQITKFYDRRTSAVVVTYDDWFGDTHTPHMNAAAAHQANRLWMSPGVNAEYPAGGSFPVGPLTAPMWADMQDAIDAGYVEPHNHGLTHKSAASYADAADAENEITGGRDAILANITMPVQSRRGVTQYVHGFVEPNGATSALQRAALADAKALNDRSIDSPMVDFVTWNDTDGLYNRSGWGVRVQRTGAVTADDVARDAIIAYFDTQHALGDRIILVYSYAYLWNDTTWGVGTPGYDWIEYVGGHDDIWSVGWGHLYQYRRMFEVVETETLDS